MQGVFLRYIPHFYSDFKSDFTIEFGEFFYVGRVDEMNF